MCVCVCVCVCMCACLCTIKDAPRPLCTRTCVLLCYRSET